MPVSERTPLLSGQHAEAGPSRLPSAKPTADTYLSWTLYDEANRLISHLKASSSDDHPPAVQCKQATLAIYIYALHLLDPHRRTVHASIRARLAETEVGRRLREILNDKIEDLLDCVCGYEHDVQSDSGIDDLAHENKRLQQIFWIKWRVQGSDEFLSAIDLLLPPYRISPSSPFLSHPTVRHVIDHTWSKGLMSPHREDSRWIGKVGPIVTPARLHALHLASFLVLYGLSLSIALSPGGRISPFNIEDDDRGTRLSSREVWWIIWAGGNLIHSFQYSTSATRRILLLPVHLAALFALFPSYLPISYNLVLLSIPTLTFALILPAAPSLPILVKPLLPLSILLRRILSRTIRSAGLIMPLVLGLLVLFSWSMNGDIFRGFYQFPLSLSAIADSSNRTLIERYIDNPARGSLRSIAEPVEDGISPFPARLAIFVTLSVLLIFSIVLSAARAIMIPLERWDEEAAKRWKGAIKEGDDWEKEYGVVVARQAREAFCCAVNHYAWLPYRSDHTEVSDAEQGPRGSSRDFPGWDNGLHDLTAGPDLLSPLNLVTIPLEILAVIPSERLRVRIKYAACLIRIILAGLLCLPIYLISLLIDRIRSR
ncbi:uncharacterized protein I303_107714 [Kwoniella dejecticola CBS 10117]|uniref:Uncharacterized protein n=1 Tax=Kwoniella dejecticola CBS 10117 TaxID=1296121 RepID=A0A1A5ZVH3_9TREE|nr:uncharacterized protein I303_07719 [Kwoniella dejecticola CBS 10117]OBR81809.1 hypothetical protein I303_07719 [Kwoniella dejecticola CBS 10117]